MKVLIAGGGIGGLAPGIALRKTGVDPPVPQSTPGIPPGGAGLVLAINALSVLKRIGIAEQVIAAGAPLLTGEGKTVDGALLQTTPFNLLSTQLGAPAVAFHRAELHDVLAASLGPDHLRLNAEVTSF